MVRTLSFIVFSCLFVLVLQLADGEGERKCPPWCVARSEATNEMIKTSLDWLCSNGADCSPIKPNGPCYGNGALNDLASYAFNAYFQKTRVSGGLCDYGSVATLTDNDPSHGACQYTCTPY